MVAETQPPSRLIGPRQARLRRVMLMFLPTIGLFLYCLLSSNLYSGTEILIAGIVMIQLLVLSNMKRKARDAHPLVHDSGVAI